MFHITGAKFLDYLVLNKLDDQSIYNLCQVNKKYYQICQDADYFKTRISKMYDDEIVKYKPQDISFVQQYKDILDILYVSGYTGELDPKRSRIDLVLVVNKINRWIPDETDVDSIMRIGNIKTFEFVCERFGFNPKEIIGKSKNEILDYNFLVHAVEKYTIHPTQDYANYICEVGDLKILKYLVELGVTPNIYGLNRAFEFGHREIINWLLDEINIQPNQESLEKSVYSQQIDIFEMLLVKYTLKITPELINTAVIHGNILMIQLILLNNNHAPNQLSLNRALLNNKLANLTYLWDIYKLRPSKTGVSFNSNNFVSLIWYCHTFNEKLTQDDINEACLRDYIDIVKYGYGKFGLIPDASHIGQAAENDNYDIIKFLYDIGISMDFSEYIDEIPLRCSLRLLKFIYDKYGLHPSKESVSDISKYGQFHILNWMKRNFGISV